VFPLTASTAALALLRSRDFKSADSFDCYRYVEMVYQRAIRSASIKHGFHLLQSVITLAYLCHPIDSYHPLHNLLELEELHVRPSEVLHSSFELFALRFVVYPRATERVCVDRRQKAARSDAKFALLKGQ